MVQPQDKYVAPPSGLNYNFMRTNMFLELSKPQILVYFFKINLFKNA